MTADDVETLRERIDELEARVDELENGSTDSSSGGYGDHRDQAVLDALEPGTKVRLSKIRNLYRRHTDVTNARTIKSRTKALLQDGPFDQHGRTWVYRGGRDE